MFLTWNLTPWATVKGELLSGAISGRLAALQGPHCITIADGIYRSYGGLDVGGYVQRNSSDLDEVVIDPLGLLLQFKDQSSDFIPKAALQPGQSTNECREIILHALNSSADRIAEIENVIEEERILPDSLLNVRYSINRAKVGGMFAEVFRALRRSRNYWKSQWISSVISGAISLLTSLVAIAEIQKGNWFVVAALLFGLGGWGWILYANRPGSYIKRANWTSFAETFNSVFMPTGLKLLGQTESHELNAKAYAMCRKQKIVFSFCRKNQLPLRYSPKRCYLNSKKKCL